MKRPEIIQIIFMIVCIILLVGCLLSCPHWYYNITKLLVSFLFIYFINANRLFKSIFYQFSMISLVALFDPIGGLQFRKPWWNVIDIMGALIILFLITVELNRIPKNN